MGVVVVAIAQTSANRNQGGPSNLQRFIEHHPPTFTGGASSGSRSLVPTGGEDFGGYGDHIRCYVDQATTFRLEGESEIWWDWVRVSRDPKTMTWG